MMDVWRLIEFGTVDIRYMMAMDEAILRCAPSNTLFFWTPVKSIILGYFQKAEVELKLEACTDYTITRRISGGGIAFSDERGRQINYGVVGEVDGVKLPLDILESYHAICSVLIDTLKDYGLDAGFRPINDVVVGGRKISGNAQTRRGSRLLQNGTLLIDFDVDEMLRISNIPSEKHSDKQVNTLRDGLTWMDRELGYQVDMEEVKSRILHHFEERFDVKLQSGEPTEEEKALAEELLEKYSSPQWIFK
jgi:lipoate-protein ligase A